MSNDVLFEGDSEYGHYIVADTIYAGRPARVLYSGQHEAAQSGAARDDKPELLFDYNQRFMELVTGLEPKRVLLIGGGAFTLPKALMEAWPSLELDVVELDPLLLPLARRYFDFKPTKRVQVFQTDGADFLQQTSEVYDLIMIDAFTHTTVPATLQSRAAASQFRDHLRPGGVVAMNCIATYHGLRSAVLQRQISAFRTAFSRLEMFPASPDQSLWLLQNFIVTAHNTGPELRAYFRYQPLELPG